MSYETDEAIELLGKVVADDEELMGARATAARELVEAVLGLKGKVPGIAIAGGPAEGMVVIAHRARRVGIAARSDGSIVVGQLVGGGRLVESTVEEVPLAFDPANGTLVGQGIDDSRAPMPGRHAAAAAQRAHGRRPVRGERPPRLTSGP